jgi:3-oxoadipate enol-lactonase
MQVTINGIDTRYVLSNEGGGPWLTFVHQLGGDLSVWDQLAGYFRDDYTVLRYDLRGHGDTALSPDAFSITDLADDLAELLDKLGAPRSHVVGLSIGGMVAQEFAAKHAGKADTLTVAGAPAHMDAAARPVFEARAQTAREQGMAALVEPTLERWLTAEFRRKHPEVVEQIGETIASTPPEGFARAALAVSQFDARDKLASIAARTLVVAGRDDSGTPYAASKVIADTVKGARFELLDAAHLSPIEDAQRFTALLDSFLRNSV